MVNKLRRFWRGRRGASMVEFALVLPILVVLATGLWEFGRVFDSYLVATNAAREGARWAALGEDQAAVDDRVGEYLQSGYASRLSSGELTAVANTTCGMTWACLYFPPDGGYAEGAPGSPVRVIVPISVKLYMPGPLALGSTFELLGDATMRLQTQSAATPAPSLPTMTATATVPALPTATATVPGPTATATVPAPTATATATVAPAATATATATPTQCPAVSVSDVVVNVGSQVTVSWSTNVAADSSVAWSSTDGKKSGSSSDSTLTTSHSLKLNGVPSGTYNYQISSSSSCGQAGSYAGTFTK